MASLIIGLLIYFASVLSSIVQSSILYCKARNLKAVFYFGVKWINACTVGGTHNCSLPTVWYDKNKMIKTSVQLVFCLLSLVQIQKAQEELWPAGLKKVKNFYHWTLQVQVEKSLQNRAAYDAYLAQRCPAAGAGWQMGKALTGHCSHSTWCSV